MTTASTAMTASTAPRAALALALLVGLAAATGCPDDPAPRLRLYLFATEGQNPVLVDAEPEPY